MEVFDHQQRRAVGGDALQQRQQRFEQAALGDRRPRLARRVVGRLSELGRQTGQFDAQPRRELRHGGVVGPGQAPQDACERCVGQLPVAEGDAVAAEDPNAVLARLGDQFVQQPALADARLTRDEDEGWPPRGSVAECGPQLRELGLASDQSTARHSRRHRTSIAPRPCGHAPTSARRAEFFAVRRDGVVMKGFHGVGAPSGSVATTEASATRARSTSGRWCVLRPATPYSGLH